MISKMKQEQAPVLQNIFLKATQNLPFAHRGPNLFCGDTFVASHAGEELGFACVRESGEVCDCCVLPQWQRKTVGSQILQAVQSEREMLYVESSGLSGQAAQFFIKNGFYAQENKLVWRK